MTDDIERYARHLYETDERGEPEYAWPLIVDHAPEIAEEYRDKARAAAARQAAHAVPAEEQGGAQS